MEVVRNKIEMQKTIRSYFESINNNEIKIEGPFETIDLFYDLYYKDGKHLVQFKIISEEIRQLMESVHLILLKLKEKQRNDLYELPQWNDIKVIAQQIVNKLDES